METQPLEVLHGRHNPLIDTPHGLHIWGWEVPVYLFLGGVVAGTMILLVLLERSLQRKPRSLPLQLAPFAAMVLLSVGMGALALDLEHPWHIPRFFMTWEPSSPMSWGSWIITLVYPVLLVQGLGGLGEDARAWLRQRLPLGGWMDGAIAWSDRHRGALLNVTLVFGVSVGIYTGLLLGTMAARLAWNTAVLGPLFLTSGISTGAAFLLLQPLDAEERHLLVRWDLVAIVVELVLLGAMLLGFATGGAAARAAIEPLLGGGWTAWFWSVVVLGGLVTPLLLGAFELRRNLAMTRLAPALVLVGGYALRAILVGVGQETSFSALSLLP